MNLCVVYAVTLFSVCALLGCVQCWPRRGRVVTRSDSVLWWQPSHLSQPLPLVWYPLPPPPSLSSCFPSSSLSPLLSLLTPYRVCCRVRIAAVNFKGKQLLLEMMPPPVSEPSNQLSILAEYIYLVLYHVPHRTSHTRRPSWWTAVPKWPARPCGSHVLSITRSSGIHINTSCSPTTMALMCLPCMCRSVKTEITRRPSTVSLFRRGSTFRYRSGNSSYV